MLRFVWGLSRQEIKHYRMKVVTFGLTSSPYQACACLKDTAKIHELMYLLAAAIVIADSFMDDIASGAISVEEGSKLIKQILTVMDAGEFRGHKISTIYPHVCIYPLLTQVVRLPLLPHWALTMWLVSTSISSHCCMGNNDEQLLLAHVFILRAPWILTKIIFPPLTCLANDWFSP